MTDIREHLATVLMEWSPGETEYQWFDKNGNRTLDGILWNPPENIEQAIMCGRKVPHLIGIEFDYRPSGIICTVLTYPSRDEGVQHFSSMLEETEACALSIAAADATGWEES